MIHGDREEREMFSDDRGSTGVINMFCDWADTDPIYDPNNIGLPRKGDLWPGTDINLHVVNVQRERYAVTMCKLRVTYSTEGQITDDFMSIEFGMGVETFECSLGWKWQFGEAPDAEVDSPPEQPMAVQMPIGTMTIRVRRATSRAALNSIMGAVGKISNNEFMGFIKGGVRFDGFQTVEGYDDAGNLQDASLTMRFSIKARSWRDMWHTPEIQVDEVTGRDIYWQNRIWKDDEGKVMPNWTPEGTVNPDPAKYPDWPAADPTRPKHGTPMWITDIRGGFINIEVPGDPDPIIIKEYGWGQYYKPYYKDPTGAAHYLYDECDFHTELGLVNLFPTPEVP